MSKTPDDIEYVVDLGNLPPLAPERRAALQRLAQLKDEDIDLSDIPEFIPGPNAVRGKYYRALKQSTTVRVDADVLAWLKAKGKGYQTRLNAILREAMLKDVASKR